MPNEDGVRNRDDGDGCLGNGLLALMLVGSVFFLGREFWLDQNARYDGNNRLSEPPIVGDFNEDGIPDVRLRYLDGMTETWKGYLSEDGDVAYRLSSD